MAYTLGVDIGTTGAKGVLLGDDGAIIAKHIFEYPYETPKPLWSEQNPEHWWRGFCECTKSVLDQSGVASSEIAGIGLSGQMHGLVLLDDKLQVLRPAILWNDQRTGEQCRGITARMGIEKLLELTGNPVLPGFTLPKILWVSENEPQVYVKASHFLLPKDYVRLRLTGELATEVSDASGTSLFDVKNRSWCPEMFQTMGIPQELAAPCFESQQVTGSVTPEAARACGLSQGTPVVGGGGDQAAQALGTGLTTQGQACVTIGTSGVVFAPTKAPLIDPEGRLHSFCHAVPGTWHVMGVMLSAGGSLRWLRDTICDSEKEKAAQLSVDPYTLMMESAEKAPAGSEGLLFLPYLSGERTPYPDPKARGCFVGLTLRHDKSHMIRSVVEGVSYGLRDCLELIRGLGIDPDNMIASGGGAKSALWREILANIFGLKISTVNITEGAALGAALLAATGTGIYDDVQTACSRVIESENRTPPDVRHQSVYNELYRNYRALYPALKEVFHSLP